MGITCSYTLEASYGGTNMGSRAFTHFNTDDYESIGRFGFDVFAPVLSYDRELQRQRCGTFTTPRVDYVVRFENNIFHL
jgi:hypothetical protein